MVNGAFYFRSGPRDFSFQGGDAGFQFGNGQRPQILLEQAGYQIISLAWQIVIQVHAINVDPVTLSVNKEAESAASFWEEAHYVG